VPSSAQIFRYKSIYGLAVDTHISYLLASICRCIWSMETRLIETPIAYLELMCSTGAACGLCYMCWHHYHTTTKHSIQFLRVYVTAPAALVLAFFFHPGEDWISMQILVAYTMYQEALGCCRSCG
jgi:ER lumen protein retaining receptor